MLPGLVCRTWRLEPFAMERMQSQWENRIPSTPCEREPAGGLKVEEFAERQPHFVLQCFRQHARLPPEQRIVPGEDLVDEDVAIRAQTTGASRDPDSQRKGLALGQARGQREYHGALEASLSEFVGLYGQARPSLAWLRSDAWFEVDDIDVPAPRNDPHDRLSREWPRNSVLTT